MAVHGLTETSPHPLAPIRVMLDGIDVTRNQVIRAHSEIGYVALAVPIDGREPAGVDIPSPREAMNHKLIRYRYYGRVEFSNGFRGEIVNWGD